MHSMPDIARLASREPQHIPADGRLHAALDELFAAARPRLYRLAQARGMAPDVVDDVVQETLIEAWRSLDHLHDATRFDAWLDGVCRNVCRRQARATRQETRRQAPSPPDPARPQATTAPADPADPAFELADPQALDPLEALTRQDLVILLDRALGYLPAQTRRALELCYLIEMPQQEAAEYLGMTENALGVRLHRARRQLARVLSIQLHAEAREFGLLDEAACDGAWRETRLWCNYCGHHRLRGMLQSRPAGQMRVRLRCPACWPRYGVEHMDALASPARTTSSSLLPAYKRAVQRLGETHATAIANGYMLTCPNCQRETMRLRIVSADELPSATFPDLQYFAYDCPTCGPSFSSISVVYWLHPAAQRFVAEHPRYLLEPDMRVEYAGHPAFRFRLTDMHGSARLTTFADAQTLTILATFEE